MDADERLKKYVRNRNIFDKEVNYLACKERLRSLIKKKMTTLMVGAIAEFEKYFGEIWGDGVSKEKLTDEQLDEVAVWALCRNKIFDIGNSQIRAVEKELDEYAVEMSKHMVQFTQKGIKA